MEQTVSIKMGGDHIADKTPFDRHYSNRLVTSNSFETILFSDLQEMLSLGKTIEQYLKILTKMPTISYKGFNKFEYVNVVKALQTIIDSKRRNLKRCNKQKEAIAFLHQEVKFSPNLIQNMLRLFNVKLEISQILKASHKVFLERPQPKWLHNIGGASGTY
jgi:hypothetical protein